MCLGMGNPRDVARTPMTQLWFEFEPEHSRTVRVGFLLITSSEVVM
jgi:hypothetical protein